MKAVVCIIVGALGVSLGSVIEKVPRPGDLILITYLVLSGLHYNFFNFYK